MFSRLSQRESLLDHRFHQQTLQRTYPALSHIPFETHDHPERRDPAFTRRLAAEPLMYLLRHGRFCIVQIPPLIPRFAASLADANLSRLLPYSILGIYLLQLESLAAGSVPILKESA
jgi:hypothetical protein